MRRYTLASLLVVAFVCLTASGSLTAAKSIRMPVDPAAVGLTDHQLIGRWVVITPAGAVPATFGADGTVLLEFPPTAIGNDGFAFVSFAVGTWAPIGARGGAFTAVQTISHANGVYLGTATIDGYLTMRDDRSLTDVAVSLATITIRDANDQIVSVSDAGDALAAMTATRIMPEARSFAAAGRAADPAVILGNGGRDCATCAVAYTLDSVAAASLSSIEVRSAGVAYPAASIAGAEALLGNGGRACTWCGAVVAGGLPVASGSSVEISPAEARYIAAKDAALEPIAAAPVAPSVGGGCNTCR